MLILTCNCSKYSSVTPEKLFQAMQTAYDKVKSKDKLKLEHTINEIMAPWVNEPGYPILNVEMDEKANNFILTQERFYSIKPSTTGKPKFTWYIPINYIVEGFQNYTTTATEWMDTPKKTIKNEYVSKRVIFNNLQTGTLTFRRCCAILAVNVALVTLIGWTVSTSTLHYVSDTFYTYWTIEHFCRSLRNEQTLRAFHAVLWDTIGRFTFTNRVTCSTRCYSARINVSLPRVYTR